MPDHDLERPRPELFLETFRTELDSVEVQTTPRSACLVHIYPRGQGMGARYELGDAAMVIGRGADADLRIEDNTLSRRHARIRSTPDGFLAEDLQSTNGTFINDQLIACQGLEDGDYLRTGNCIFRFLGGGNLENAYHEEIYRLTIIDALTGAHNKRFLLEFLDRELSRSRRYQRPLSLVLFDIDHFKQVNDAHGHLAGDFTLRELAGLVRSSVRAEELFARYGGEEFALVLPETPLKLASQVAERIREVVENHRFQFDDQPLAITISLGVASTLGEVERSTCDLLAAADAKLYQAKRQGRNRVEA